MQRFVYDAEESRVKEQSSTKTGQEGTWQVEKKGALGYELAMVVGKW